MKAECAKKPKKVKPYNWQTKITAAIRKVWRFSPERREALNKARDPNEKKLVQCAACLLWVNEKLADVDHVDPVVPLAGFDSFDAVIRRMQTNAMQVLCDECHAVKTKAENAERARIKREAKKKASRKP